MTENNSVMVVAVLAVIASLAAAGFSYYAMSQGPKVSGFLSNTDTGTASLEVTSVMEVEFTDDTISWGSGRVDTGTVRAVLDSSDGSKVNGTAWASESSGLILENKGNVDVNISLSATKIAATLIGGTSPTYQWKITNSESSSCAATPVSAYSNANASAFALL